MTAHWELDSSPETAAATLHGLFGWATGMSELIEISIKAPSGKWRSEHVRASELYALDTTKKLAELSATGREAYVGCVGLTEKPKTHWRRGGAAIRGHAGALWIDVDCEAPGRTGSEYYGSVDEAVAGIDAALGPVLSEAALVVGSGWGVQYWVPLSSPVEARIISRTVRVLIGYLAEKTGAKIDRVWDVTRVMRMPGTWNWRGGPDPDDARATGIIRMPLRSGGAAGRLSIANVIDELASIVDDVSSPETGEEGPDATLILLDALVDRFGGTSGAEDSDPGARLGDWAGDIERIAHETLTWEDVLEPYGWRCVSGGPREGTAWHEQIWERPGKDEERSDGRGWGARTGERSAVVYADRPELLVVYSDSLSTGFSDGLRGSGHRGEGAGVGVISKWRSWVDLGPYAGNAEAALHDVSTGESGGGDEIGERLAAAWATETTWMTEWLESEEWTKAVTEAEWTALKSRDVVETPPGPWQDRSP